MSSSNSTIGPWNTARRRSPHVHALAQEEGRRRLQSAGFVLVRTFAEGTVELWRHPVVGEVRLVPELDGTGAYEEVMILMIEAQARGE